MRIVYGLQVRVNGKHFVTFSGQPLVGKIEFLDMLPASSDVFLHNETDLIELNYVALTEYKDTKYKLFKDLIPEPKDKNGNLIPMVGTEAILDYAFKYRINAKPGTTVFHRPIHK